LTTDLIFWLVINAQAGGQLMELNMQCILVLWLFSPDTGKNITSITAEVIQKWKDDSGFKQFPILILSIAANPVRVKEIDISLVTKYFKPA